MKKISRMGIISIMIWSLLFSLSSCAKKATDFSEKVTIENGINNFNAGGSLAFIDDSLYVVNIANASYYGTYLVNSDGAKCLFDQPENLESNYSITAPRIYQYNNTLLFYQPSDSKLHQFDRENNTISNETLNISFDRGNCYISDDLSVYSHGEHLMVQYKDNEAFQLEYDVSDFCVYENKIYFISGTGGLYYNDPSLLNPKSVLIKYPREECISSIMMCGGYCYYIGDGSKRSNYNPGLYRYSFDSDQSELIKQEDVLSLNQRDDTLYFATNSGIYAADETGCKKISGIKTEELYIFGDEWIYTYDSNGKIYRLSVDGKTVERVIL